MDVNFELLGCINHVD